MASSEVLKWNSANRRLQLFLYTPDLDQIISWDTSNTFSWVIALICLEGVASAGINSPPILWDIIDEKPRKKFLHASRAEIWARPGLHTGTGKHRVFTLRYTELAGLALTLCLHTSGWNSSKFKQSSLLCPALRFVFLPSYYGFYFAFG